MKTRQYISTLAIFFVCVGLLTLGTSLAADDVGPVLPIPPGPPNPNRATITVWSEAGQWGDSYILTLAPTDDRQTSMFVPPFTLESRNLAGRISSARLTCGARQADVFFTDAANNTTGGNTYHGRLVALSCDPARSVDVNFHEVRRNPGNVSMGDRITSFQVYVHAENRNAIEFSRAFSELWKDRIEEMLPSEAKLSGDVQLTYLGLHSFKVRQYLKIDGGILCPESSAWFEYSLAFYVNAGFPGQPLDRGVPVWRVTAYATHVSGGWHCKDEYESALEESVSDGRAALVSVLNEAHFGNQPTYYLTPIYDGESFYLNWGG